MASSSGSHGRVTYILERLHLVQRFKAIVTGDDVPHGKPNPAIFQLAAKKIQLRCAELLAVEDAISGVRAAKSVGMKCLGVADGDRALVLFKAGADHVVSNFRETSITEIRRFFSESTPKELLGARLS